MNFNIPTWIKRNDTLASSMRKLSCLQKRRFVFATLFIWVNELLQSLKGPIPSNNYFIFKWHLLNEDLPSKK